MSLTVSLCRFHFQMLCSVPQNPYYSMRHKSLARGITLEETKGWDQPWIYNPAAVKYTPN